MAKFKVGDRVRYNDNHTAKHVLNRYGVITGDGALEPYVRVQWDDGTRAVLHVNVLKLAPNGLDTMLKVAFED